MFRNEEIPSLYIEDYKTLHHDIGLVQRSNGLWDLWFGQDKISERYKRYSYLDIIDGDLVSATELHSLQVGIIVACLTSWNYLNRTGNPIYSKFGNESYSLLKRNKGTNTQYKIKHYFIECLNRMRRVYSVEYLNVYEVANNPHLYKVVFKVLSVTNTLVDGEFYLDVDAKKNTTQLELSYNHPYTSVSNPLFVECVLKNEYGSFIEDELLYIYIKKDGNSKFEFYGVTKTTDEKGSVSITIPPNGLSGTTQLMFVFRGNSIYNPCVSRIIRIENVAYYIKSRFTHKIVQDDNGNDVEIVDKQILYVEDSLGNTLEKFRLGELLSDYTDINSLVLSDNISLSDIHEHTVNENILEFDENEQNKLYLVPNGHFVEGTNEEKYDGYCWNDEGNGLMLLYSNSKNNSDIRLNSKNHTEIHFLIDDDDNGLFEIGFDGHLYYHINEYENEM